MFADLDECEEHSDHGMSVIVLRDLDSSVDKCEDNTGSHQNPVNILK